MEALRTCRMRRATLLIARLDRLSRNFALVSSLCESDIDFVAVDLPEANRLTIHLLAAIAEYEAKLISDRIKAALAVAKARGVKLGGNHGLTPERIRAAWTAAARARTAHALDRSRDLAPLVWQLRKEGKSCRKIARELEKRGIKSFKGVRWYDSTVREILLRTTNEFSPNGAPYTAIDVRKYSFTRRVRSYAPLIFQLRSEGLTYDQIAGEFNRCGIRSPRAGRWHCSVVWRLADAARRQGESAFIPVSEVE